MKVEGIILDYHNITITAPQVTVDQLDSGDIPDNANIENFQLKSLPILVFREHMKSLKEHARVVSLSELMWRLHNDVEGDSDDKRPYVAITFDDSYKGVLHALAILEEFEFPATMFLTTGYIDSVLMYWTDQLEHMINLSTRDQLRIDLPNDSFTEMICYQIATAKMKMNAILELKKYLKARPPHQQTDIMAQVETQLGLPDHRHIDNYGHVTRNDVLKLHRHPLIRLGTHTVTHPILPTLNEVAQRYEIEVSQAMLEKVTGKKPTMLSYPEGRYNDITLKLLRKYGITIAPTATGGVNRRGHHRHKLFRYMPSFNNEEFPFQLLQSAS